MLMTCQNRWIKIVNMEDIFDLSVSQKEHKFVKDGLALELDVSADVIETFCDIPYIGSLIKLGRIGSKFQDLHFIRKLAKFLEKEKDIPEKEKEKFLDGLTPKRRKKLYEYLTHYLLRAEDDAKADIMGYIYKERVYGRIDDEMFLRLCSIVDRAFVFDLKFLPDYVEGHKYTNDENDLIVNQFINLGLIDNDIDTGAWSYGAIIGLNDIGLNIHRILESNGWYKDA